MLTELMGQITILSFLEALPFTERNNILTPLQRLYILSVILNTLVRQFEEAVSIAILQIQATSLWL